jgi:MYXO-CTERM domain-containing protein
VSVSATGISEGSPRVTFTLASVEAELVASDNSGVRRIEVKDSDSGGGSTGPLFLLLMTLVTAIRRRR